MTQQQVNRWMIKSAKEKIQNYLLKGAMRYQSIKDFNTKSSNALPVVKKPMKSRSPSPEDKKLNNEEDLNKIIFSKSKD
jgi:hypothetical protein